MAKNNIEIELEDAFPLTGAQKGILFNHLANLHASLYTEQMEVDISGDVDLIAFTKSWENVIRNNQIFRTVFDWSAGADPLQVIIKNIDLNLNFIDLRKSSLNKKEIDKYWHKLIKDDRITGYDLMSEVSYRLYLIRFSDLRYRFLFSYHHILLDGYSAREAVKEAGKYYSYLIRNKNPRLISRTGIHEYLNWLGSLDKKMATQYWKNYYSNVDVYKHKRKHIELTKKSSASEFITLSQEEYADIKLLSVEYSLTVANILGIIWGITYSDFLGRDSLFTGIPVSIRPDNNSDNGYLGLCINTVPLYLGSISNLTYIDVMLDGREQWSSSSKYSFLSLSEINRTHKDFHADEPFDTIFTFSTQISDVYGIFDGLGWNLRNYNESTQYPISVDAIWKESECIIKITFREEFYSNNEINNILKIYKKHLHLFLRNPHKLIAKFFKSQPSARKTKNNSINIKSRNKDDNIVKTIIDIWLEMFPGNIVTSQSNFFELGGDSLSALSIISKLRAKGIAVNVFDMFKCPTPKKLSAVASYSIQNTLSQKNNGGLEQIKSRLEKKYLYNFKEIYPASYIQSEIVSSTVTQDLFHDQSTFVYKGDLNYNYFKRSWNNVVGRNDSLKSVFLAYNDKVYQCILKHLEIDIDYVDLSGKTIKDREEFIKDSIIADRRKEFNTSTAPLIRLSLYKISDNEHTLFLRFHVSIMDGWCFAFVLGEVMDEYESMIKRIDYAPSLRQTYKTYVDWLENRDLKKAQNFWRKNIDKTLSNVNYIPRSINNNVKDCYETDTIYYALREDTVNTLKTISSSKQLTINTILQLMIAKTIYQGYKIENMIIGATVSGRPTDLKNSHDIIGLFFNDIPTQIKFKTDNNQWRYAKILQKHFHESLMYQYLPIGMIKGMLGLEQKDRLFQILFVYENYPKQEEEKLKYNDHASLINTSYWRREMSNIDITIYIDILSQRPHIKICYLKKYIAHSVAREFADLLNQTLLSLTNKHD